MPPKRQLDQSEGWWGLELVARRLDFEVGVGRGPADHFGECRGRTIHDRIAVEADGADVLAIRVQHDVRHRDEAAVFQVDLLMEDRDARHLLFFRWV